MLFHTTHKYKSRSARCVRAHTFHISLSLLSLFLILGDLATGTLLSNSLHKGHVAHSQQLELSHRAILVFVDLQKLLVILSYWDYQPPSYLHMKKPTWFSFIQVQQQNKPRSSPSVGRSRLLEGWQLLHLQMYRSGRKCLVLPTKRNILQLVITIPYQHELHQRELGPSLLSSHLPHAVPQFLDPNT